MSETTRNERLFFLMTSTPVLEYDPVLVSHSKARLFLRRTPHDATLSRSAQFAMLGAVGIPAGYTPRPIRRTLMRA
jgi:hypothetical protein